MIFPQTKMFQATQEYWLQWEGVYKFLTSLRWRSLTSEQIKNSVRCFAKLQRPSIRLPTCLMISSNDLFTVNNLVHQ